MKKILLLVFILTSFFAASNAQPNRLERNKFRGNHDRQVLQKMNLSEDQKQKAKSIHEAYRKQMEALQKNDALTVKDWKEKRMALAKNHREELQGLLTTDQKKQIATERKEKKELAAIDAKARMEKMKIQLGLSKEQTDKLKKEQVGLMEKMKALRENPTVSMDQKRKELKPLLEKRKEILQSVLTPEQRKKLQTEKRKHARRSPSFA